MAEKDVAEKILLSYNDVFADLVNVLLFDGERVIAPDELEDQAPRSYYKTAGEIHEIERDVVKRWTKEDVRLVCIGLENQTDPDPDMPLRVIGYDGASYRSQLSGRDRYPVITMVLYFGYEHRWKRNLTLKNRLRIPRKFDKYINDYKMNLFEIAYLEEAQVNLFQSDFRIVADYFVQKRKNHSYVPSPIEFQHVQETLQLLSIMAGDQRFEPKLFITRKGGPKNMCEVLDQIENRGYEKGVQKGIQKGIQIGSLNKEKEMVRNFYAAGSSEEYIAKAMKLDLALVKDWITHPTEETFCSVKPKPKRGEHKTPRQ